MDTTCKTILFLLQRAPYGSSHTREMIDALYAASAFDQNVHLLFTGEGIWQLLPGQHGSDIASKDVGKLLGALAYYDINALFVDRASLESRQLDSSQLALPVIPLGTEAMRTLLRDADCVVSL